MGKMTAIGTRFEGWIRDQFRSTGWQANRLPKRGVKGEPDVYATYRGVLVQIQAKERQRLNAAATLDDLVTALETLGEDSLGFAAVVWKRMEKRGDTDRRTQVGPVVAVISFEDYMDLLDVYARQVV